MKWGEMKWSNKRKYIVLLNIWEQGTDKKKEKHVIIVIEDFQKV